MFTSGLNFYRRSGYHFCEKNTNTIKMKEEIDLFCWQDPELNKYLQQERGIPFRGEGG